MKFIFILANLLILYAKRITNVYTLNEIVSRQWIFMTKFAVNRGEGSMQARVRLKNFNKPDIDFIQLDLFIYWDENWSIVLDQQTCANKRLLTKERALIHIPTDGSWSNTCEEGLYLKARQKIWYFATGDCEGHLSQYLDKDNQAYIEFEIITKNVDGSHFSSEDGKLHLIYLCQSLVTMVFAIFTYRRYKFMRTENYEYHRVYFLLLCSLLIDLVSEFLLFCHYEIYSWQGEGSDILNFLGQLMSQLSQFLITATLVLVAHGWTISYDDTKQFEFFIPVGIIIVMVQILLVGISNIATHEHDKYHDFHGTSGFMLVGLRGALWGLFVHFTQESKKINSGITLMFYERLLFIGSLYLLAFPIVFMIADNIVVPYYRHRVITITTILVQHFSILMLTYVFTSKKALYSKINQSRRIFA